MESLNTRMSEAEEFKSLKIPNRKMLKQSWKKNLEKLRPLSKNQYHQKATPKVMSVPEEEDLGWKKHSINKFQFS